ncbi:ATP-dependent DNA helicase [Trichonephila clavipes]|nr:ATP-dependent DNA helicase [Trichonephila clavipes]
MAGNVPRLNPDQQQTFIAITGMIGTERRGIVFLDAPGGTDKIFLLNLLLAFVRKDKDMSVASSGISATQLAGRQTATFGLQVTTGLGQGDLSAGELANKLLQREDCKVPEDSSTCLIIMPYGEIVNSPDELLPKKQLPGQEYAYKSIDYILNDDEVAQFPIEFLNSIQTPDLQAHNLILKVGDPIMLIRIIDATREVMPWCSWRVNKQTRHTGRSSAPYNVAFLP